MAFRMYVVFYKVKSNAVLDSCASICAVLQVSPAMCPLDQVTLGGVLEKGVSKLWGDLALALGAELKIDCSKKWGLNRRYAPKVHLWTQDGGNAWPLFRL